MSSYTHFTLAIDAQQVAHVAMDIKDSSVNLMRRAVMEELGALIGNIAQDNNVRGLIFSSSKPMGFVFGADIKEFESLATANSVAELVSLAHNTLAAIEALTIPTVCLIDGIALGGGLELALPFDHIIALDTPKSQLGFPEIQLGLMPGFAGTGRATLRVGAAKALDMCLSGKPLNAKAAYDAGLVDSLADTKEALYEAGIAQLSKPISRRAPDDAANFAAAIQIAKASYLDGLIQSQTPAPFNIIQHYEDTNGSASALIANELIVFPKLMMSEASYHLRRVYKMTDAVRKSARGEADIQKLHVIGAGTMGGDIAAMAALQGFEVTLSDTNPDAVEAAILRAATLFERRLKTPDSIAAATKRLSADTALAGVKNADIIIEAASEQLKTKQDIFLQIEAIAKPDAILATNTSTIMIEDIATSLATPSRLIGLHFFNPATILPLIEVIAGDQSDEDILKRAMRFAGQLKKMPVRVKSAKGFLVNRALLPYIYSAIDKMQGGANPDEMDEAMLRFGMPMGPIELADQIGLDVCYDAGCVLGMPDTAKDALSAAIKAGNLGRKSGAGFYSWEDKKAIRPRAHYDEDVLDQLAAHLLEPFIASCRDLLDEGVVASQDDVDIGCIFGTGFPTFRGGPLGWANYKRETVTSE